MNKFVMLAGLPGSGKSTYCKSHSDYIHISSDALRKEMGFEAGEGTTVVFHEMMVRTKEALGKGQTVIWDATDLTRKRRMGTLMQLNKYNVPKHCICFTEPVDVCVRRNSGRTGFDKVPESIIYDMAKNFEVPNEYEGFNEVRFIQTVKGIEPAEYLKMAENFDQDNPHHDMTLYEHMSAAYECACELVKESSLSEQMKENVRLAALYHDIGKLYTKDYHDTKGNETDIAHYYRHENVGAYMYLSSAAKVNIEQIPEKILEFYEKNKKTDGTFQIVVGTDSQNFSDTKMVTVVAAYKKGHGGIFFYEVDRMNRITSVKQKLNTETSRSLEVMMSLVDELEEAKYMDMRKNSLLSIHVDAGWSDKGKTKELIPGLIGWIKACGFEAHVKPESFAASSIADKISK